MTPLGASPRFANSARIAAAIPAYEAAGAIADVVRRTLAVVTRVLVVDDGSTDGGGKLAADAGARIVTQPVNRGKGAALRTAFETLFGLPEVDAVVTLDADGQHLPEEIPVLLSAAGGSDLVLGSRRGQFLDMSPLRRASNRASSWAISRLAGQRLLDVQTGFRLYTRRLIETLGFPHDRFEAESAIVVRAVRRGFRVVAVPVRLGRPDGRATSHYRPIADSLLIAQAVIRARLAFGDRNR